MTKHKYDKIQSTPTTHLQNISSQIIKDQSSESKKRKRKSNESQNKEKDQNSQKKMKKQEN